MFSWLLPNIQVFENLKYGTCYKRQLGEEFASGMHLFWPTFISTWL